MSTPILTTKLYIPQPRSQAVARPQLVSQLNAGLSRKLTLISAAAGFGKTSLLAEWSAQLQRPVAWLALDEGDSDLQRFLRYLVAALQTIVPDIGKGLLKTLQAPQPPPLEAMLTMLLNELTTIEEPCVLVLDDYHSIDSQPIDQALNFLIKHLPPTLHIVLATREDPALPLARLRAKGQLAELRIHELRFTLDEIAHFFKQALDIQLTQTDLQALETRTEGWIAGLQLAALSMQGHHDTSAFIRSFTGSHHFVLDYLLEEVWQQQPEHVQTFLLRTSILERMCGSLSEAVLEGHADFSGQTMLEQLEAANLFIIPLDNERRWYRYHHLFAELLRQRLQAMLGDHPEHIQALHIRASEWYETQGLVVEAFQHAVASQDIDRAARLVEGNGMPLPFRGIVKPVLYWLDSLDPATLDEYPGLWVIYASTLLFESQIIDVEAKLQAAEHALAGQTLTDDLRNMIGHIASIRAVVAATQHQVAEIIIQAERALEYLAPENIPVRTATTWTLGYAHQVQGNRTAAKRAYHEAIATSEMINHTIITIMASLGLGTIQEQELQLQQAQATYQRVLQLTGEPPLPVACDAYLGLSRIHYEWNDLEQSEQHGRRSVELAQYLKHTDRAVECEIFLARLQLAQGDLLGATARLTQTEQVIEQYGFIQCIPNFVAVHIQAMLKQDKLRAAAELAQTHELPLEQARVALAQNKPDTALALIESVREQAETMGWADLRLQAMLLQVLTLKALQQTSAAHDVLNEILMHTHAQGLIRSFIDHGPVMAQILNQLAPHNNLSDYITKILSAFAAAGISIGPDQSALIEPLSERELEILHLMAEGLSNQQIAEQLMLALSTIKGHNRNIFGKLQVQRRTEAVARARELALI